ncbi:MAG: thioredoxin domain-containing protein [Acidobacteria bacterium]|nr:thioredoxin domain-containing protein [Acidobacteriota bacterium]
MSETLNSLSKASSAYLRSAMHQPIQWQEWGAEAFAQAQRENKPVLLDIGAVWCHWCHVMDRESYDSPEIAQIVNEKFIPVKVDRDERPDIDSRYQVAVQAVSGQGGWPLTAFLTPEGTPFFGGTYFPPQDQYGRPSFKRVLLAIAEAYHNKSSDVADQAKLVESAIANAESFAGKGGEFSPQVIADIVQSAVKMFDERNGGFGSSPKFPHPSILDLLIDQFARHGSEELREVFTVTLEKMALGGVYDQLAGGFHRYSVDEYWIVPHFEKMSYDNSELLKNYVHAYQATGAEFFAEVARDIVRWMEEWLSDRERGGFYASQDADYSMDDDGDYFTWTVEETRAVLDEQEAQAACLRYDIDEVGEMHHNSAKNVLYVRTTVDDIAKRMSTTPEKVRELLQTAKQKMYAARLQRPTPYVDKTMYTGWNALCVSAFLRAGRGLGLETARHFALRSLDRILAEGWQGEGGLLHVIAYSDAQAPRRNIAGVLDDYACTVVACLDAYEATADLSYFRFAGHIAEAMVSRFFDPAEGGFFDTEAGEKLGVLHMRRKPFQDSPTPAGNAMAAIALSRLHAYTGEAGQEDKAERTLEILAASAGQYGIYAATYGIAAVHLAEPHAQVVIVGSDEAAAALFRAAMRGAAIGKAVVQLKPEQVVAANLPPLLAQTIPALPGITSGRSVAVVCSGFRCQGPVSTPEELATLLAG